PRDPDEHALAVAFPPSSPAVQMMAADIGAPLAFVTQHRAYEGGPRAAFTFIGDVLDSLVAQQVPVAPTIAKAIGDPSGVTLTWAPQDHVLGFAIELRQPDGSERLIGVAAGSASSTRISYGGLLGTTLRLRAWNAAGLSSPSAEVQPATRMRAVGK
ncbi:MAG TPA: fibronectin type III domain-containing protein, partial [Thermoanaerobaculia bacterium]